MTFEQFSYWLQGFVELTGGERPSAAQWQAIGDHLQTVFKKVTPERITPQIGSISTGGITQLTTRTTAPSLSDYAIPASSPLHTAIC